jgi:hypothetical protein
MPDFSQLRMQNWFGQQPYQMQPDFMGNQQQQDPYGDLFQPKPFDPYESGGQEEDVISLMKQYYTPETQATDRFNQLIQNMPQREEPGMLRKIAASVIGLGNKPDIMKYQEHAVEGPYMDKMADWKMQTEPAYQAANLERYSNANERQMAANLASASVNQRKVDQLDRKQDETERNNQAKNALSEQRNELSYLKYMNPNLKFYFDGPTVLVGDPKKGTINDTKYPTGNVSEMQRIMLNQENALERISAGGDQARLTKETPSADANVTANLPTQQRIAYYDRAMRLKNDRPEYAEFIELGDPGSNDVRIIPPDFNFMGRAIGPTPEEHQEILNYIRGNAPTSPSGDMVYIWEVKTGARKSVPRKNLEAALATKNYTQTPPVRK